MLGLGYTEYFHGVLLGISGYLIWDLVSTGCFGLDLQSALITCFCMQQN
jgi:hypothetical protein